MMLNICLVQTDVVWENIPANLEQYTKLLKDISADVIILPELFSTGFTMRTEAAYETMDGNAIQWMKALSENKKALVMGSLIIKADGQFYNRLVIVQPNHQISYYDKRHLFRMGDENKHFAPGTNQLFVEYKHWQMMPLVCYDLRFPVWSRNVTGYDLLVYVANWPAARSEVWKILLKARAIENQCYVVGVNRIGTDGRGIEYYGESCVVDPKGKVLFMADKDKEIAKTVELDLQSLRDFREKFPVLLDKDKFKIS